MYAKVKLHYIELQQRRLAALEMCSTAKDMVTGPTGETRLVLPSSELRRYDKGHVIAHEYINEHVLCTFLH